MYTQLAHLSTSVMRLSRPKASVFETMEPTMARISKIHIFTPAETSCPLNGHRNLRTSSMSISLLQSTLNVSAVPLFAPPPSPPDVYNCDGYYSDPIKPLISDCRVAFKSLPIGFTPIAWYTEPGPGRDNILPIEVRHGKHFVFLCTPMHKEPALT